MSYNGSGTFQINTSGQPVVTGTVISSSAFNALTADLATGLSTAITKDGQTATTVRIPFAQGINSSLTTDSTNTSTGSIITAGGVGIAKALFVGTTANVAGVATFGLQPILSSLTASKPVFTDVSKGLVSTGTLGADQGGTGVANNAAMTVTGSGNFAYTRTLTAATNVTFPTTGTLATRAGSETFTNKTLTAPVIATIVNTGTLTLPTSTDTLVGKATTDTLTNKTLTTPNIDSASVPTVSGTAPLYMARAWVNFNGTGTVAIRASGNVSSITDGGVGIYTVNFTTSLTDTSFAPNVSADIYTTSHATIGIDTFTSSSFRIRMEQNSAAFDSTFVCASVFR
jgi:hypothetical protein